MSAADRVYELKVRRAGHPSDRARIVQWSGTDGENAARRYVDAHRGEQVEAWRDADRHGIYTLGRGQIQQ